MEKVSVAPIPKPASQPVNIESNQQAEEQEYASVVGSVHGYGASYADGRGFDLTDVPAMERKDPLPVEKTGEGGLIVEDGIKELRDGQMGKGLFMEELRAGIIRAIEPVLARVGQTTEGCPYLNYWLGLYERKDAAHIEGTVRKYAPDSVQARTAGEYIDHVVQRALRAAEIWALTGKVSGVPEGVPLTLPGREQRGVVQAKARMGGVRNVDDPVAIREELGDGELLGVDVRQRMEAAFGMSFSHVRAHTDVKAAAVSRRVNARAFTVGNHVAFGHGEYRPGTMAGDALIAHELAHTIQQNEASGVVDKMEPEGAEYSRLERDADRTAAGVAGRLWGGFKGIARQSLPVLRSGLKLQRCGASQTRQPTTAPAVPAAPDSCPTSVVLESTQDMTPGGLALGYRTGYGILSVMHLLPDSADWSRAQVFERVSQASTGCPDTWNICNPASRPFPINQSTHSTVLGELPAQRNRFYDFHTSRWNSSRLHDSTQNPTGMDECRVVCNQSYVCGERVLGNFRITRHFRKAMRNGREITEVNTTKTAVP